MKRPLRFVLLLVVALGIVPFLPLYLERTMLRSWLVNPPGTIVEWGWKVCSLSSFWSEYSHLSREQEPAFWLKVNLVLAFAYALLIALGVDQLFARRKRRREVARS